VSGFFKDLGAHVYNADKAVHVLYQDMDVKQMVLGKFGLSVFKETEIDRKVLADIVFNDPVKMEELTDIIYPRIKRQIETLASNFRDTNQEMLLLDVPLLVKAGMAGCCDKLVYVTANDVRRQEWAVNNRGWTTMDLMRRDALLAGPIIRKHVVLTNNNSLDELQAKVQGLVSEWKAEEASSKKKWTVKRQDDIGNVFIVEAGLPRQKADALLASLEVKGHKQTYFVEEQE
jgi:dephospho-CoA kinase